MRILIIANYRENRGGISAVVNNHFKKLKDEGLYVEIFSTKRTIFNRIILIFSLLKKIKKFDIIHIHVCSYFGFFPVVVGLLASKILTRRKTIVTYHGGGASEFLKKNIFWVKWFLKKADSVTVMSEFLQKVFSNYGMNTIILRNLLDFDQTDCHSLDLNFPKILSVRYLSEIYNIPDILEAFILVKKEYALATIQIAGNGVLADELKGKYSNIEGVEFLGQVPNKEVSNLFGTNNIFVSVPSFDNQPMSILEAFSMGIPVISSNVGGIPYMIKDGLNGFLVEVNSPDQIAEKIRWVFSHRQEIPTIVNNAKQELVKYQWPEVSKVLFSLYFE